MSIYSDYKCGALSDEEYDYLASIEGAKDDYEREYPLDEEEDEEDRID